MTPDWRDMVTQRRLLFQPQLLDSPSKGSSSDVRCAKLLLSASEITSLLQDL